MKKPKLSEIRARNERARKAWEQDKECTHYQAALDISGNLFDDIPHLLNLAERLGKALSHSNDAIETAICNLDGLERTDGHVVLKEARALLKELEL